MSNELPDAEDSVSYDPETETYRATFDNETNDPSIAVVKMIANVCDQNSTKLGPLNNILDPDALDRLLQVPIDGYRHGDLTVEFTFQGHIVTILSCGIIKMQLIAPEE